MSAASVRRLKDRGGSGGKVTAGKPLTPLSEKPSFGSARKFPDKENPNPNPNPRSISRVSARPAIKPMLPRISNPDSELPRSNSRPRGRSPSPNPNPNTNPSDFNKILSDLRKTRVTGDLGKSGRVFEKKGARDLGGGRVAEKGLVGEKGLSGFRVSSYEKEFGSAGKKKVVGGDESDVGKLVSGGKFKKVEPLVVNHVKSSLNDVQDGSFRDNLIDNKGEFGGRNDGNVNDNKGEFGSRNGVLKQSGLRSSSNLNVYDGGKEKGVSVNEGENQNQNQKSKQASRLQAKLAYLEGKVKKIASDIKKTKEILDMNNTDASKVMLSDIQDKISGIEEGMGKAIADFHTNFNPDGSSKFGDSERVENDTMQQRTMHSVNHQNVKQPEPAKLSVKGLSGEELEARLFPHHKLLRNRPSVKLPTLGNSQSSSEDDENPITIEFLASLNKDHSWVVQEVHEAGDAEASTTQQQSTTGVPENKENAEVELEADERLDDFDDRENKPKLVVEEDMEEDSAPQLMEIGRKTSTGGWFVSEGESVLLAHDDGSCSFYDVANQEEKAEYRPPSGIPKNLWKDCWIIRAPSADGCSGKYVVAASAGNTMDSGFCSWDFYTKDIKAFHTEDNRTTSRAALGSLRRNALAEITPPDNRQWWYRPCGPLMVSTASCQRTVKVFDIRDGEQVMKWDVQKPVLGMDYCSPLQWRNRGKVVVAETEGISLWDVSSQNPQALLSVSTSGRRISALHVNNTDAELGGGVRQRVSSSEAEGNDGVFCTVDSINVLDFRHPSGIGLKLPKIGVNVESVFSRGDSIFLGCNSLTSSAKDSSSSSQVLQFSLRKQGIISTYQLPESNAHSHHKALTQVWGNSSLVMATCGLGLFIFDAAKDEGLTLPSLAVECGSPHKAKEVVGPNDLYLPTFDYHSSQVLLISRDRPAMWRHLL